MQLRCQRLLDKQEKPLMFNNVNEALNHFSSKLYDCERLRVEQSYVLEDALAYYKSVEFQPHANKMNYMKLASKNGMPLNNSYETRVQRGSVFKQLCIQCGIATA